MFSQKLNTAILNKNSRLCVGLDPRFDQISLSIRDTAVKEFGKTPKAVAEAIIAFNTVVLDVVAEHAVAIKPQIAFYELFGPEGIRAFWKTVELIAERNLLVIADIKRGDIGSTAQAYAQAYLGGATLFDTEMQTKIDAVTINPFLGEDALEPFFTSANAQKKGTFTLVKTSNPGSGDIQDLQVDGTSISQHVAEMITSHIQDLDEFGYSNHGAVVGATYPEEAQTLRKALPKSIFLVPGIGAQGGDASMLKNFFDDDGLGAVVSSSRGVTFGYGVEDTKFAEKIAKQAEVTKDLVNKYAL